MSDKTSSTAVGNGSLPLRPAMASAMSSSAGGDEAMSPRSGPAKVVSINEEPEHISPMIMSLDGAPPKQFSAGIGKRVGGKSPNLSSRNSFYSQQSMDELPPSALSFDKEGRSQGENKAHHHQHHHIHQQHDKLLTQVAEWLQAEKAKRASRKAKKHSVSTPTIPNDSNAGTSSRPRTSSESSGSSAISLEKLQRILEDSMGSIENTPLQSASPNLRPRLSSVTSTPRRKSSIRQLIRTASSDTEYQEGDVIVPSCDVVLDNSKTLSYSGGNASTTDLANTSKRAEKERRAWSAFKGEILRLAHTLRLKGWRRVPLDSGDLIDVERLSGALTNAVYVVSPPKNMPTETSNASAGPAPTRKPPPKLLLRIYGPQVEHLIDRENELGILRRLARKKIGPRLLGTFQNGRFEEYFASTTLTSADLRVPETSKQIAKRMRELHDGIDLLSQEREDGAFVWRNWDKWVDRCELVIKYLDDQILSGKAGRAKSKAEAWKERGLICGVEWKIFKAAIDNYRKWLLDIYGGEIKMHAKLVFAHNDTQYGNILRLKPSGESPLLLPANSHKQLIVIDFEYASANTPGLEFANHFTEWCYNYHDEKAPYACNTNLYPNPEEQRRFIRSYVNHRPQFNPRASATPKMAPKQAPSTPGAGSISDFLLDSRTPSTPGGTTGYDAEEAAREKEVERQVEELVTESRLWRIANSAQWVAWGIVQAKVPDLDEDNSSNPDGTAPVAADDTSASPKAIDGSTAELMTDPQSPEVAQHQNSHDHDQRPEEGHGEDEDEFDYLAYAQERAMFFWGDVVELGLVRKEELPRDIVAKLKIVKY